MSPVDEAKLNRVIVWMYYYLGIRDGISANLDSLNRRNPEPLKDAKWRIALRSYLPIELATLRQTNADQESAARAAEASVSKYYK